MSQLRPASCRHTPIFGGPRLGPTVTSPSYQLVLNAEEHLFRARWDVATWADRIHRLAVAAQAPNQTPEDTA